MAEKLDQSTSSILHLLFLVKNKDQSQVGNLNTSQVLVYGLKIYQMSVFSVDMTVKSVASKSSGGFSCTGPNPLKTCILI
jgi:hypothetical protein